MFDIFENSQVYIIFSCAPFNTWKTGAKDNFDKIENPFH